MDQRSSPNDFKTEARIDQEQLRAMQGFPRRSTRKQVNYQQDLKPLRPSIISSQSNSNSKQFKFEDNFLNRMMSHPKIESIEKNIELIKQLTNILKDSKTIIEITSNNEWQTVTNTILSIPDLVIPQRQTWKQKQVFQFCRQFVFPFIFGKRQKNLNFNISLIKPLFVSREQFQQCYNHLQRGLSYYNQPIVVFRECSDLTGLDLKLISLDTVAEIYANNVIDIRIQNPCEVGFIAQRLANYQYQMTIGDYIQYQKIYNDQEKLSKFAHFKAIKYGRIFFGVNFDAQKRGDDVMNKEISTKLKGSFLINKQKFDLLSYLDDEVPGCTLSQIYLKVQGCWTGGHQENISMSSININLGPDSSEWFAIQYQYVQDLRIKLMEKFKVDLYLNEGLWFEETKWFIENNFPITKIVQKKGDIVISGPGTLHWVRSNGVAMHSSWNVMIKNQNQVKISLHRHKENQKINYQRRNVIAFKSILLRLLNHQNSTISPSFQTLVVNALYNWFQEEVLSQLKLQFYKIIDSSIQYQYLQDLQSFCEMCKDQVLLFYSNHPFKQLDIICLACAQKEYVAKKSKCTVFSKFPTDTITYLLVKCMNKQSVEEILDLCKGKHIGDICCSKDNNKILTDIFQDKYLGSFAKVEAEIKEKNIQLLNQITIKEDIKMKEEEIIMKQINNINEDKIMDKQVNQIGNDKDLKIQNTAAKEDQIMKTQTIITNQIEEGQIIETLQQNQRSRSRDRKIHRTQYSRERSPNVRQFYQNNSRDQYNRPKKDIRCQHRDGNIEIMKYYPPQAEKQEEGDKFKHSYNTRRNNYSGSPKSELHERVEVMKHYSKNNDKTQYEQSFKNMKETRTDEHQY